MEAHGNAAPVLIKRKRVIQDSGHHGGAWKVAYADFVTAMMAFFLLMWLMNATTEKQRKGVAEYFSPTIPMARVSGGGDGLLGGDNVFSEELESKSAPKPAISEKAEIAVGSGAGNPFKILKNALADHGDEAKSGELHKHLLLRPTDEGLVIDLFGIDDHTLFENGSSEPTLLLQELVKMLSDILSVLKNPLALEAHVAAQPRVLARNTVWELSTGRADRLRQLFEESGLAPSRLHRVTGHADRDPLEKNPMATRNNRLEIIVLTVKN